MMTILIIFFVCLYILFGFIWTKYHYEKSQQNNSKKIHPVGFRKIRCPSKKTTIIVNIIFMITIIHWPILMIFNAILKHISHNNC